MNKQSRLKGLVIVFIVIAAGIGGYAYYKHSTPSGENSTPNSSYNSFTENQPSSSSRTTSPQNANTVSQTTGANSKIVSINTPVQYKTVKENQYSI
jgi:hypothetical protein